mgnify:CR=1 FL=1
MKNHIYRILILFGLFSGSLTGSHAQDENPTFQFEIFEMPGGVLGNMVQCIVQDSLGFMWFASQNGLHRWDGYEFVTYINDPLDSTSIHSNYVETIEISPDGELWLGTWGDGLSLFDYETQSFQKFSVTPPKDSTKSETYISDLLADDQGNLWIATTTGLNRMDLKTREIKQYLPDENNPNSISDENARVLYGDKEGNVWIGTGFAWTFDEGGGLSKYRPESDDFIQYKHDPLDSTSLINNKITSLFEDSKGNFWVGTVGDGLHLMDREKGTFLRFIKKGKGHTGLGMPYDLTKRDMALKVIFEDQQEKLWFGAWQGGIRYFDPKTGYTADYYFGTDKEFSLPRPFPWTMFQSRDGTIWGTTTGESGKVFKIKSKNFKQYNIGNQLPVICIAQTQNYGVLASTILGGILQLNQQLDQVNPFVLNLPPPNAKSIKLIERNDNYYVFISWMAMASKIVEDKKGRLWIRKDNFSGMVRVDEKLNKAELYIHDPEDPSSISEGEVLDIIHDSKGRIWMITGNGVLNLYHEESNSFIHYPFSAENSFHSAVMLEQKDGRLGIAWRHFFWKAKEQFYYSTFDIEKEIFSTEKINLLNPSKWTWSDQINGIVEDKNEDIWICTAQGLIHGSKKDNTWEAILAREFGSTSLKGMAIDPFNRLWLAADQVLLYDIDKKIVIEEGRHNNFILSSKNPEVIYANQEGQVFVGGNGVIQQYDANKIGKLKKVIPPTAVIRDFQILKNNEGKAQQERFNLYEDNICLKHNQNDFSVLFSALDFNSNGANRHQFILDGYDDDWRESGLEPIATYIKVNPGTYTFRVRGASKTSDWGPERSLKIKILSPWWASWWAYTLYGLSLFGILYSLNQLQINRKLDKAEAKRLSELDRFKTKLYTNITHEFRTPLTVINGMLAQIQENPKEWMKEGLIMIQRNSNRLLDLVNQMLALSKLESGKLELETQHGDMVGFTKYIVESIHSLAESKSIQVHFYAEEKEVWMDHDPDKIQQILTNLLSNAIKFTPEGGNVYVSLKEQGMSAEKKALQIKIRDTGTGISEDQLPFIFDRFYQVDDTLTRHAEGSGIGLALVKELVKLMNGDIAVKSRLEEGTSFEILLPITHTTTSQTTFKPEKNRLNAKTLKQGSWEKVMKITDQQSSLLHKHLPEVLIVEDNPDVVAYIAACLQGLYKLKVAKDGAEGIEIALKQIPDLIITDVMMPKKNGYEVCQTVKQDQRTSHIPVVMLTAKADLDSKLEGLSEGADAYLSKPFHKEELLLRIKKLLELRKQLQSFYRSASGLSDQKAITEKPLPAMENEFIKKVKAIVETNLDNFEFNVEQLCREVHLSHSQLHRKLSALTGLSANRFIRHIRLYKAKEMLKDAMISITAVAFDTGFNDPSYFGRMFKKEFGKTPKEYQEYYQNTIVK